MVIFLYGSDGYRLKENVDTIVGAYRKKYKSGISYYRFDLSGENKFDDFAGAVKSVSFFDEAKLIIVKNASDYTGLTSIVELGELIRDFKIGEDRKTVLVFVENKSEGDLRKANKDLFTLLAGKNSLVKNFEHLAGIKLSNWVKNEFKKYGHAVSTFAVDLLVNLVGNESWALANEISKLSNYKKSGTVTEKDMSLLVNRKEDNNIFDLVDAIGNQNKAKAFEMVYRLTNSGHDPHYLLSMLVYHFENLLSVFEGPVPKHLHPERGREGSQRASASYGIHPFVAQKSASQARRFSKEDLLSKFNYLAELDVASKNGLTNLEDALYNFVIN